MNFHWYCIEISIELQLDFQSILDFGISLKLNVFPFIFNWISKRFKLVFHGNSNWISKIFPLVFHWNFNWITIGLLLVFHWNFNWISDGIPFVFHWQFQSNFQSIFYLNWIFNGFPLAFHGNFYWISTGFVMDFIGISIELKLDFQLISN